MGYFTTANPPAQAYEVIEAVRDLVAGIAALTTAIGGAANVFEHRNPEPPDGQWKRIVVRPAIFGDGSRSNVSRSKGVRVDVMVEVQEQVEKPERFLAHAHELIFQNIVGQVLALTKGTAILGVQPYTDPTAASFDEDDNSFFSTAGYIVATVPA